MFLIKKGKIEKICSSYMLDYYIEHDWKLIKSIKNIPNTIKKLPVYKRNKQDIIYWYMDKIEKFQEKADKYKLELAEFKKICK